MSTVVNEEVVKPAEKKAVEKMSLRQLFEGYERNCPHLNFDGKLVSNDQ